jgi:hypothetical protein
MMHGNFYREYWVLHHWIYGFPTSQLPVGDMAGLGCPPVPPVYLVSGFPKAVIHIKLGHLPWFNAGLQSVGVLPVIRQLFQPKWQMGPC